MENLTVTEYQDIRVLTTQQIAEAYGTNTDTITKNFNRNKDRYTEGKHFICLEGQELKDFKTSGQIDLSLKINRLYLWTEKGAFLHAKSLNTDVAWEVYDKLVDSYFNRKVEASQSHSSIDGLSPQLQFLINVELKQKEQDAKLSALDDKVSRQNEAIQTVKEAMTDRPDKDFSQWVTETIRAIANSPSFENNPLRFQSVWSESYKRLTDKAGCRLDTLLKNAKQRAAESGASKSKVNVISKLSVIADDKRLKELYITCIREMMIAYCIEG